MVGLGNPGPRLADTRHNAGFEIVRKFAARERIHLEQQRFEGEYGSGRVAGLEVGVLLPQTFMNASGRSLSAALAALPDLDPAEDVLVVYDDLDLPLGRVRLRARGSAGGQLGMQSVIDALASDGVARLRFGVGRPPMGEAPRSWVLAPFAQADRARVAQCMNVAADAVLHFSQHGVASAMDRFNGRDLTPETP